MLVVTLITIEVGWTSFSWFNGFKPLGRDAIIEIEATWMSSYCADLKSTSRNPQLQQLSVKRSVVLLLSLIGWTKVCAEDLPQTVVPQIHDNTPKSALSNATSADDPRLAKQAKDRLKEGAGTWNIVCQTHCNSQQSIVKPRATERWGRLRMLLRNQSGLLKKCPLLLLDLIKKKTCEVKLNIRKQMMKIHTVTHSSLWVLLNFPQAQWRLSLSENDAYVTEKPPLNKMNYTTLLTLYCHWVHSLSLNLTCFKATSWEKHTLFMDCVVVIAWHTGQLHFPSHAPEFIIPAHTTTFVYFPQKLNDSTYHLMAVRAVAHRGRHWPHWVSVVGEHAVFSRRFSKLHWVHLLQGATPVSELNCPSLHGVQTPSLPSPKPQSWESQTKL